ncbi:hypothetical protein D5S18_12255 [Nocardia panacis]|uniref:Uncharacterized protein n=1 Tax=Nocardia panacis TaxID=2340916 RepID=A0A3A4KE43_9NOCA|nr:hypothetical protein [Nocardia panacis]RJO76971.1 hypothetical protein D5S18_12255 [Nocardia panacis]
MNHTKLATAALIAATIAAVISSAPTASAQQVWGACGISTPEDKVVANYSKARLTCGNTGYGFRHIQTKHGEEWQGLAAIENRNWRDIADMAISKSLDTPDLVVPQGARTCYSGQIYLVNHVNGQIAKTVEPTVIVDNGIIVTAFPGGKCRA